MCCELIGELVFLSIVIPLCGTFMWQYNLLKFLFAADTWPQHEPRLDAWMWKLHKAASITSLNPLQCTFQHLSKMARLLLLICIFMSTKSIHSIPQPDDIFSSELDGSTSDPDVFLSDESNPLESSFNGLFEDMNDSIFRPSDEITTLDPLIVQTDAYPSSEDTLVADDSADPNQLQSLCRTEGTVSNDFLRPRDGLSCPSTERNENIQLPDLFQDPEAWRRRFSPQQKPPTDKQGAKPLDSILRLFGGFGGGATCPPEYPIRCCTDLISGYIPYPNAPTLYYIKPLDCIASMCFSYLFLQAKHITCQRAALM